MSALGRRLGRALRRLAPRAPAPFESKRRPSDPSPAVWRYRLDRLARRGYVRFALRRLAGPAALIGAAVWLAATPAVQDWTLRQAEALRVALIDRPEFAVERLEIEGGTPRIRAQVERILELQFPVSSLRLDLRALRETVETAPGVASAEVAVLGEVLTVRLVGRAAAALWRWEGQLHLVDAEGVVIAPLARRAARPELPLLVGDGADRVAAEGLALWTQARPIEGKLRALVRVGERRWTLALLSGQEIWLPAEGAEAALARVLDLHATEELLEREVAVIDLRDPERPVLRLTARGLAEREKDA